MAYTRVGFNESFQEWAKINKLTCGCSKPTPAHLPDEHVTACSMSAAFVHWKAMGSRLYAEMPKTTLTPDLSPS